jgi:hypothetical protein
MVLLGPGSAPPEGYAQALTLSGFIGGPPHVNAGGLFTEPSDVAVFRGDIADPDDDKIFVVEAAGVENGRVQRLDAHGNFELMWGKDVVRPRAPGDRGSGYEICSTALSGAANCKAAPAGARAGEFKSPTGIAVSETTGHVYVMDRGNRRVQQFDAQGRFIRAWGWGVKTGSPAPEICRARCWAGRAGGPEGEGNAGQFADSSNGSIAIDQGSNEVFATDLGNRRLLQFHPDGGFVRAWGVGVDSGARTFEVCTAASGCRSGKPAGAGLGGEGWPRYVALDPEGVVYSANGASEGEIVRFSARTSPEPPNAQRLLREAFRDAGPLGTGEILGLEADLKTGRLVVPRDPLGPMVVHLVSNPGGQLASSGSQGPRFSQSDTGVPIIESINGVGIGGPEGSVYLPVGTKLHNTGNLSTFDRCGKGAQPCHGLIVLGRGGDLGGTFLGPVRASPHTATLRVEASPHGVARYDVQLSMDGRTWKRFGGRYVSGVSGAVVSVPVQGLEPDTLYRVRLALVKITEGGEEKAFVNEGFLLTEPATAR